MTFGIRHFMDTKFSLRKDRNTHSISIFSMMKTHDYVMGDFNLFQLSNNSTNAQDTFWFHVRNCFSALRHSPKTLHSRYCDFIETDQ